MSPLKLLIVSTLDYVLVHGPLLTVFWKEVYGANGRLGASFLSSIHVVLQSIATIANDLNAFFPLSFNSSVGGITRVAGHLHLYYHQVSAH